MSLTRLTACELLAEMAARRASAVEVARAFLDRIDRLDGRVRAFLRTDVAGARAAARGIDQRRAAGGTLGPLAGLPVAVKDVLCVRGQPTTCASRMLEGFRPPYDATVVARLRAADAVIVGKTNMDEFAMGGSTENSAFGPTHNPWDLTRIPGGSSGGAAACVAADMAPLSIGSDTGGSIRQPAALCGVTGLKPTYGRVSRYGLVAFASSLDQVGPLARTAEDCALLLATIAGHDPRDSTSVDRPVPPYVASARRPLEGLRLGVVREHVSWEVPAGRSEGLDGEVETAVREAIGVFRSLGASVREVALPRSARHAVATYYLIAPCEASSNLARYDGVHYGHRADEPALLAELATQRTRLQAAGDDAALADLDTPLVRLYRDSRAQGFGPEVKRRIMLGSYALSAGYYDAYYLRALRVRRLIRQDYDAALAQVDVLIGPVTPTPAFPLGEKAGDPLAMYLFDVYTVGANLAGVPAMSLPCGMSASGLPIGVQLQAAPLAEELLLRAGCAFQQATDWHTRRPALGGDA